MVYTVAAGSPHERDTLAAADGKTALPTTPPIQFSTVAQALLPVLATVGVRQYDEQFGEKDGVQNDA